MYSDFRLLIEYDISGVVFSNEHPKGFMFEMCQERNVFGVSVSTSFQMLVCKLFLKIVKPIVQVEVIPVCQVD